MAFTTLFEGRTTDKARRQWAGWATGLALAVLAMTGPAAADDPALRLINVMGEGEVAGTPDMALVYGGVSTTAPTAREALDSNSGAMEQVMDSLRDAGVEDRDIQTSNFLINPQYKSYPRGQDGPPVITGYTVSNMLTVRVRDLDKLGGLLDTLVTRGANQFRGLSFTIADPEPLIIEARRRAVADALGKARLYAEASGVSLGAIQTINERDLGRIEPPPPPGAMTMRARAESVPVAAGELSATASVSMTIEITGGTDGPR